MRTPSKKLTNVVAGMVAAGFLTPSCTNNFLYDDSVLINSELPDRGLSAIDISLSKEDMDYLRFLNELGNDIITNPVIAKEFVKNPQLFVEKYGYNAKIDLEENLLKLILSLSDDDINSAIKAGDIKLVLTLMKDKGLLNADSYTKINISEEQKNQILTLMGIDEANFDQYGSCTVLAVCVAYVFVGVASIAAVVYMQLLL